MFSYSRFEHSYDIDFFKIEEPISTDYRVFAKGEEIPVYTARISKYPFNVWWIGHQRSVDQSELCSYINLVGDEEVTLTVEASKAHSRVMVKPYSRGIVPTEENGTITFSVKPGDRLVLELDDYHGLLYVFYSEPIRCDDPESVTHYFGPGIHYPRRIDLQSGDRVYIDKDALVYGCFFARDAEDIEIFGNGVIDDSGEERFTCHCYEDYTVGNLKFYDCKGVRIRGIGMKNSAIWCLNLFHCTDVVADGIKIFGQWRYNTDGIDICNCRDVLIRNSFVHSFDDTITLKGILRYRDTPLVNIHVENCVLWCDWGKTCEIGIETACEEYRDISFANCDVLRAGSYACDIGNGYTAHIHNVRFEDIRVEYNAFDTAEQLQETDDMVYTRMNDVAIPNLLQIWNGRFEGCGTDYSICAGDAIGEKAAWVSDVVCRDISVYYDEGVPLTDGKPTIKINLLNERGNEGAKFENIEIENISVNGKRLASEDIVWGIKDVDSGAYIFR